MSLCALYAFVYSSVCVVCCEPSFQAAFKLLYCVLCLLCVHPQPNNLSPSDPLLVSVARQLLGVLVQLCATQSDMPVHAKSETVLDTNK